MVQALEFTEFIYIADTKSNKINGQNSVVKVNKRKFLDENLILAGLLGHLGHWWFGCVKREFVLLRGILPKSLNYQLSSAGVCRVRNNIITDCGRVFRFRGFG